MYFEFDDVRRIHQPYTDPFTRRTFLHFIISTFSSRMEGSLLQLAYKELEKRNVRCINWSVLCKSQLIAYH